jgi:hypothetical protein
MSRILHIVFTTALVLTGLPLAAYSQDFKATPFSLANSKLLEQIRAARAADPKMTNEQLADAANALLQKAGLSFQVFFDATTCEKLKKARDAQKDPSAPLKLGTKLQSLGADTVSLSLDAPNFVNPACGGCYVSLNVLEITDSDLVSIIQGQNIKFARPQNFLVNEAVLLDAKERNVIKRRWRLPFRTMPIGISSDENVLYLGFDEPELAGLSLLIYSEGVFQFGTRAEAELGGKGSLEPASPSSEAQQLKYIKFDRWGSTYIVRYAPPC